MNFSQFLRLGDIVSLYFSEVLSLFLSCCLAVTKQLLGCLALQIYVCLFEAVYLRSGTIAFFCLIIWADTWGSKYTNSSTLAFLINLLHTYSMLKKKSMNSLLLGTT